MKPQLEQTPKKIETFLPTTGGKAENPCIKWIGLACIILGLFEAVFAVRNQEGGDMRCQKSMSIKWGI